MFTGERKNGKKRRRKIEERKINLFCFPLNSLSDPPITINTGLMTAKCDGGDFDDDFESGDFDDFEMILW